MVAVPASSGARGSVGGQNGEAAAWPTAHGGGSWACRVRRGDDAPTAVERRQRTHGLDDSMGSMPVGLGLLGTAEAARHH